MALDGEDTKALSCFLALGLIFQLFNFLVQGEAFDGFSDARMPFARYESACERAVCVEVMIGVEALLRVPAGWTAYARDLEKGIVVFAAECSFYFEGFAQDFGDEDGFSQVLAAVGVDHDVGVYGDVHAFGPVEVVHVRPMNFELDDCVVCDRNRVHCNEVSGLVRMYISWGSNETNFPSLVGLDCRYASPRSLL